MPDRDVTFTVQFKGGAAASEIKKLKTQFQNSLKSMGADVKQVSSEFEKTSKQSQKSLGAIGTKAVAVGDIMSKGLQKGLQKIQQLARQTFQEGFDLRETRATIANLGADVEQVEASLGKIDSAFGTTNELMRTYFQAHSGGLTMVSEATGLVEAAGKLAFGEAANLNDVAAAGIKTWNVYGETFKQQGKSIEDALGGISEIAKLGDTNLQAVAASLPELLTPAKEIGVAFEDIGGALALTTTRFKSTAKAATNLTGLLTAVKLETKQSAEAASELGVAWSASALNQLGLEKFIQQLADARDRALELGKDEGAIATLFQKLAGGTEAGAALAALVQDVDKLGASIDEVAAGGAARLNEVFKNMDDQVGPVVRAQNAWRDALAETGDVLIQEILPGLTELLPLLNAIGTVTGVALKSVGFVFDSIKTGIENVTGVTRINIESYARLQSELSQVTGRTEEYIKAVRKGIGAGISFSAELINQAENVDDLRESLKSNSDILSDWEKRIIRAKIGLIEQGVAAEEAAQKQAAADQLAAEQARQLAAATEAKRQAALLAKSAFSQLTKTTKDTLEIFQIDVSQLGIDVAMKLHGDTLQEVIDRYKLIGKEIPEQLKPIAKSLEQAQLWTLYWEQQSDKLDKSLKEKLAKSAAATTAVVDKFTVAAMELGDAFIDIGEKIPALNPTQDLIAAINDNLISTANLLDDAAAAFDLFGIAGAEALAGIASGFDSVISGLDQLSDPNSGLLAKISGGLKLLTGAGKIIKSIFGGQTEQKRLQEGLADAAREFGALFDSEAKAAFESAAKSFRTEAGKVDVLAAMWHPSTLEKVLDDITDLGLAGQNTWAKNLEDHVRPVLQNTLGMSDREAARAMAPLFQEILSKIQPGSPIDTELQRMINWAVSLGVNLDQSFLDATDAAADLAAETERIAVDALRSSLSDATDQLRGIHDSLTDIRTARVDFQLIGLPQAIDQLQQALVKDIALPAGATKDQIAAAKEAAEIAASAAAQKIREQIADIEGPLKPAQRRALLLQAESTADRAAIARFLDTFEQQFAQQEQIELLKEQRNEARDMRKQLREKLQEVRKNTNPISEVLPELVVTQLAANDLLARIADGVDQLPKDSEVPELASGGLTGSGLHRLGKQGQEFVVNAPTLDRIGPDFFDRLNRGDNPAPQVTNHITITLPEGAANTPMAEENLARAAQAIKLELDKTASYGQP